VKSRSVRARGLKQDLSWTIKEKQIVALRAGAWIETNKSSRNKKETRTSRSVRARGLKQVLAATEKRLAEVAPRTGAWMFKIPAVKNQ